MNNYLIDPSFLETIPSTDDTDDGCKVCLMTCGDKHLTLPCGHAFHSNCLMESFVFSRIRECPYCRTRYDKIDHVSGPYVKNFHKDKIKHVRNPLLYESLENESSLASVRKGDTIFILLPHEVIKAKFVRATSCFIIYTSESEGQEKGYGDGDTEVPKILRVKKRFCFVEKAT